MKSRLLLLMCCVLFLPPPARAADHRDSVVRVTASVRYPDLLRPWASRSPVEVAGTGTVIEGKRILTNAHLVLHARDVYVQPRRGGDKFEATVAAVAPDMDLAILTVADEKFHKQQPALARAAALPRVQDNVTVYGFPEGGTELAVTKGVVSRIEFASPYQSGLDLLIQVSAAINPGNSGGPAVVGDRMIGLVFGRLGVGENVGFVVPNEEIDFFLEDIKDGRYDGKPRHTTRTTFQRLENKALRASLRLGDGVKGVMAVPPHSCDKDYPLKEFDVLTHVGAHAIDNEGMVQLPNDLRVWFEAVIPKLARGGAVPVTLVREGRHQTVSLPVSRRDNELIRELGGAKLPYFIYGPLVFAPARMEGVAVYGRVKPMLRLGQSPLITRLFDQMRAPDEELVVVTSPLFQHRVSRGYEDPLGQVVKDVNGNAVRNLRHLVELLRDSKAEYVTFRFAEAGSGILVFRRAEMDKVTREIMEDNSIPEPVRGSKDMLAVWNKQAARMP